MANMQSLPLQLMHLVSISFASKPTPQGFLCLLERGWWDLLYKNRDIISHKRSHLEDTSLLAIRGLSNHDSLLSCFFLSEATFRYSDGRAYNRSPQWKDQRQHADTGGSPIQPYRSGDINYPTPGVSEGKHESVSNVCKHNKQRHNNSNKLHIPEVQSTQHL